MLFFSGLFCPGNGTCIPGLAISDLGAKAGQRGSNAGIVLHAQHAFSLLAMKHDPTKQSLIPLS